MAPELQPDHSGARSDEEESYVGGYLSYRLSDSWDPVVQEFRFPVRYAPTLSGAVAHQAKATIWTANAVWEFSGSNWQPVAREVENQPIWPLALLENANVGAPSLRTVGYVDIQFDVSDSGIEASHARSAAYQWLESALVEALTVEPIENGYPHPVDETLDELDVGDPAGLGACFQRVFYRSLDKPALAAGLLLAASRLPRVVTDVWGQLLAAAGLRNPHPEIREAAVRALEHWGGAAAIELLSRHQEPLQWLARYVEGVVEDLRSE